MDASDVDRDAVEAAASRASVTELLLRWQSGEPAALEALLPLVYDELRAIALRRLRHERAEHTLQPTALVHEAYLRLVDQQRVRYQGRSHFFRAAAQIMRHLLVDSARAHRAGKRGGQWHRVEIDDLAEEAPIARLDLLALNDALTRLAEIDPQRAQLVEMRFFAGMTVEETAEALGCSPATVKRQWQGARAWLHRELGGEAP